MRVVLFGWHIYCYWNVFMLGHPSAAALLFSLLVLCACTRSRDIEGSGDNAAAEHREDLPRARQGADKVREKAHRLEKKEGSQDLVRDDVSVKTNPEGDP